jgi:hypothetical protein
MSPRNEDEDKGCKGSDLLEPWSRFEQGTALIVGVQRTEASIWIGDFDSRPNVTRVGDV